jgi:CHAT domain-containing protein
VAWPSWLYRQLDAEELRVDGRSMEKVARLLGDCRHHEAQLLRHQRRLLSADAELASLQGAAPADIEAVVEVLPEDGALLEYYVARGVVYAFLLDRGGLGVRRVSRLDDLRELQQQLGFQLDKFRLGPEYVEQFGRFLDESTRVLLRRLYDELLAPLEAHLDLRHLVVVPHGILHHLPFHALHDGKRYLLDRCAISYAPSATAFRLCSLRRPRPMNRSLVLGVPDQRAPLILEEVRAVHEQLPDLRLLLGEEATAEALARFGGGCRILHLATHGLHRSDNPMFSAIQMGGSRLSLMDLYGIRLEAELAVLSGCGTGISAVRGGDELVGLTRGLLYAGARAVVATLWDVNDESTARFMKRFYRHLLTSERSAEALRETQLELREDFPHPYHWAPFLLVGRPYPRPLGKSGGP